MRFAKDLIASSPYNFLFWKEDIIRESSNQIKLMIAQNYAEKCQKFVFDQLLQLRKEVTGVSCYSWGTAVEFKIGETARLVPYVERARGRAEFCFAQTHDQGLDPVLLRDRQLNRSLLIAKYCDELMAGVAMAKTFRGY